MIEARTSELRRAAARAAVPQKEGAGPARAAEAADVAITIRPAVPGDAAGLARLAALDCAPMPVGAALIADANGRLRAAMSSRDGASIADPFHPTAGTVQLLVARAGQLCAELRRRGILSRLLRAASPRRRRRTPVTRSI
jgi:hypothetical protein